MNARNKLPMTFIDFQNILPPPAPFRTPYSLDLISNGIINHALRTQSCMASKEFNNLPKDITQKLTHGELKNEFYDFKLRSYKESTLNFASNMF